MKITEQRLRQIIKEELTDIEQLAPSHVLSDGGREYEVKVAPVEEIKNQVARLPRKSYKPDDNEVWVAKEPGSPAQDQADQLFSWMTGGFPGGPVQFYWDPAQGALFVHVRYNTF